MKTQQEYIDQGEQYILKTYNRFPVVLEKGEGVYLYDADHKKYLDFGAGIAVFALGYGNEAYNQALKDQIDKLIHTSNLYYNIPAVEAAKKIVDASGLKKVFFTNSGTEAIEGALKVARKYAYNKDDSKDYEFIAMNHSFHGRSQGALSVTGNSHYQDGFVPKEFRAVFAEFNNLEDVVSKITDKTCGIICEVVQGEGGIFPADKEFLEGLRKVCDEKDILLIFDEIQCGMGRCGSLFAHDLYGVKPDVLTLAKALGCGVPVGAFVVGEKADGALVPGDHGTTYGGNPFATAAINAVFDQFEKLQIPEHAKEVGAYLMVDMAHIAGLVAGGEHPSPIPYADVVTTTTHKTLRGPRGGMILSSAEAAEKFKFNKAVFPGIQGGPLMHVIAGKAVCLKEALDPSFKTYAKNIVDNAQALCTGLMNRGFDIVSGGTDNHLMLVNLLSKNKTGKEVEKLLDAANITCNKNTIPNDPASPFVTSGIRLGTAAVTTRGFNTADMDVVAEAIALLVDDVDANQAKAMAMVKELTDKYPLYE